MRMLCARWKQIFLQTKKILPAFYVFFLLVCVLKSLFYWGYDTLQTPTQLFVQQAEIKYMQAEENGWYISTNEDAQLIFDNLDLKVRRVVLQCVFADVPGEIDLYYMRQGDTGFSPSRRVFGRLLEDGNYEFILPPGRITALRIDPTSIEHNRVQLLGVQINPPRSVGSYLVPSLRSVLGFALLPLLAYCVIYTIIEAVGKRYAPQKEPLPKTI